MAKRPLHLVTPRAEGLGLPTIMDRALAQKHGARYVHLAVFAIDIDRVRDETETEELEREWPFAWEVFLTEEHLVATLDPALDADRELVEDACESAMRISLEHDGQVFGAQLPFAVYDAVQRGAWPDALRSVFATWRHQPTQLVKTLTRFSKRRDEEARRLAEKSLEVHLEPPLAPPTVAALRRMAGSPELAP